MFPASPRSFLLAATLVLASSPAFAQQSRGASPASPGGGEFEGPVPGVQLGCLAAPCPDNRRRTVHTYVGQFDCDVYLPRIHGPMAGYWEFRYRECKRRIEE